MGDLEAAIADFTNAIKYDPDDATVYLNRALVSRAKQEFGKVVADFTDAIRLTPNDVHARHLRAFLWATCPDASFRDGKKAVQEATKACELSQWKTGLYLDTLAAAHAEVCEFELAAQRQSQAVELVTDELLADEFRYRLKLYQSKRNPYNLGPFD